MIHGSSPCGLLHSEICGSMCAYHSPQLIAVNHVLLRLLMPRHSPCALLHFTFRIVFSHSAFSFQNCSFPTIRFFFQKNFCRFTRSFLICIVSLFCFQAALFSFKNRYELKISLFNSYPFLWWAQMDSNHRPHAYQACALTT